MIIGIHHLGLTVRDLAAAQRYYCAAAGMRPVAGVAAAAIAMAGGRFPAVDAPDFDHRLLAGRNGYLQLIAPHRPAPALAAAANPINRAGFRHFCAQGRDIAILEKAVADHGGSLFAPPLDLGTGNQYAYARDPEGNIMEIEGLPYAPAGEPTWLGHVALVTRDMDRALAFYGPLLGSQPENRGRFGPKPQLDRMGGLHDAQIEGAWLAAGNLQLEIWQFHAPASPPNPPRRDERDPGFSHLCLESDDLAADAARLVALGGEIVAVDRQTGTEADTETETETARAIIAHDPSGNVVKLLELSGAGAAVSINALTEPAIRARVEAGRSAHAVRAGA